MEAEPNDFGTHTMTAVFFAGLNGTGPVVASITQPVTGNSGARLFAAVCTGAVIRSVVIAAPPAAAGFAIAQIRSDIFPGIFGPEPIDTGDLIDVPPDATQNAFDDSQVAKPRRKN